MGAKERGHDGRRPSRHRRDHPELFQFGLELQSVPRLHLDRRGPVGQEAIQPSPSEVDECVLRPRAHIPHRREDAAARGGDLLVPDPARSALVIGQSRRPEHRVGVTIHESGKQHAFDRQDLGRRRRCPEVTF